ncbi:MAG TPA: helix-turn-helix domain-containing protein [Candidatus Eisenbacteria bacterium]|nr:helix-turn-helix domain-containing protein [Candidatus Eisenbacteria bacterium]
MPSILKALRAEIRQMARNETKRASNPIRDQIRDLRRSLTSIERRLAGLKSASVIRPMAASGAQRADGRRARFAPALIRRHRSQLGLSRKAYARLLGVSSLSVYFWETGRTRPRRETILAWQDLRKKGVRELRLLAGVPGEAGTPRRAGKRRAPTRAVKKAKAVKTVTPPRAVKKAKPAAKPKKRAVRRARRVRGRSRAKAA